MKRHLTGLNRFILAIILVCGVSAAKADTVYGVPVGSVGSTTQVGSINSSKEITFYIPLSQSAAGVYGVSGVGTSSDYGSGYGYNDSTKTALSMFLMFSPVTLPASSASLTLYFTDLDLSGANDPTGFFESVQFFSSTNSALTTTINTDDQTGSSPLAFSVNSNTTSQTISFPNITSILNASQNGKFYLRLDFDSKTNPTAYGYNTAEKLKAKLDYTPATVPEPATLLLIGTGLAGAVGARKRKRS